MSGIDYGHDRFGLRVETDFIGNAIAIDPRDCDCTDCLVGNSHPLNCGRMDDIAAALLTGGRTILNRTSSHLYVIVRDSRPTIVDVLPGTSFISVIPEDESSDAEAILTFMLENEWHEDQCNCRNWGIDRTCHFGMTPPISWSMERVLRAQRSITA